MADTQDQGNKDKSGSTCGSGCGGRCCGSKSLMIVVIFLLGGIIGFLMGSHGGCGHHGWHQGAMGCPYTMMGGPNQVPAAK